MWSVGMIILEIFVGSELVQCFRTHQDVIEGLAHVQIELGNRLYGLLRALMLEVRFETIKETLDGGILDSPERVAKSVRHVSKKIRESNFVEELLNAQKDGARSYSEEPISLFGQVSGLNEQ